MSKGEANPQLYRRTRGKLKLRKLFHIYSMITLLKYDNKLHVFNIKLVIQKIYFFLPSVGYLSLLQHLFPF